MSRLVLTKVPELSALSPALVAELRQLITAINAGTSVTSIGTLSSLTVTGTVTAGAFVGNVSGTATAATTLTTTLVVTRGGTGQSAYSVGDILIGNGTDAFLRLADVQAGSYLRSGGVLAAPVWSTLVLPNAATANRIPYASATNTWSESANLTFNGGGGFTVGSTARAGDSYTTTQNNAGGAYVGVDAAGAPFVALLDAAGAYRSGWIYGNAADGRIAFIGGDVIVYATKKLYFDGAAGAGGNTYLHEVAADQLRITAGGATAADFTATVTNLAGAVDSAGNFSVATTKFTVAAATGNTVVAGTLGVTGVATFTALPVFTTALTTLGTITTGVWNAGAVTSSGNIGGATLTASGAAALTTAAESWVGPSTTDGVYFKGGYRGLGTITPQAPLHIYNDAITSLAGTAAGICIDMTHDGHHATVPEANDAVGIFINAKTYSTRKEMWAGNLVVTANTTPTDYVLCALEIDCQNDCSTALGTTPHAATTVQGISVAIGSGSYDSFSAYNILCNYNSGAYAQHGFQYGFYATACIEQAAFYLSAGVNQGHVTTPSSCLLCAASTTNLIESTGTHTYVIKTTPFNVTPTYLQMSSGAFGTGVVPGGRLGAGRNTSGNGAAAHVLLEAKGGTAYYLWVDATGDLRIHTAAPTEDGTTVSDTAGTVVGSQS